MFSVHHIEQSPWIRFMESEAEADWSEDSGEAGVPKAKRSTNRSSIELGRLTLC